jgi:hypothetical protein
MGVPASTSTKAVDRHQLAGDGAQRAGLLEVAAGTIPLPYSAETADLFVQPHDGRAGHLELWGQLGRQLRHNGLCVDKRLH